MVDPPRRRNVLAVAIQGLPLPIRTVDLAAANASAGFSGHRNTARKDARALIRRGVLAPLDGPGNNTYTRTEATP